MRGTTLGPTFPFFMAFSRYPKFLALIATAALANFGVAQTSGSQTSVTTAPEPTQQAGAGPAVAAAISSQTASTASPIVNGVGSASSVTPLPNPAPRRHRAISSDVAAQLSAAAPKFTGPAPKPVEPVVTEEDEPDARELDKPRNGIIRLPKVIVREKPPAVLSDRAVYTQKGRADIAMKRYITETDRVLNAFTLPIIGSSVSSRALAMYEEDERLKQKADLTEDARMVGATSKSDGQYVKQQVDATFIRPGDFEWRPIGR